MLRGGSFKGGEALAGTRCSKDEFPPVTAWQNVKLFHCLALFLKGFEQIRQGPFRAGDKVKMYASPGVLVPARVIAVHPGVGGQQTMYAVETKNFPGSGVVGPMVIRDGSNAVKEHRLRYAWPDLSRNEQWVEFVCTMCGFHGGSQEAGKMFARKRMRVRVLVCVCARAGAVCLCARNIRDVRAQFFSSLRFLGSSLG